MLLGRDNPSVVKSSYAEPEALPAPEYAPRDLSGLEGEYVGGARVRHASHLAVVSLASDVLMLAAAVVISLTSPAASVATDSPLWPLAFSGLTLLLLAGRGAYAPRLRLRLLDDLRGILSATAIAAMAVISARVLLGDGNAVAADTAYYWLVATVLVGAGRTLLLRGEAHARRRGEGVMPTLVVGAGKVGRLTAKRLLEEPELGLEPVGYLDAEPLEGEADDVTLPVLGAIGDLDRVVGACGIQHVIVTFSRAPHDELLGVVRRSRELGLSVSILPRLFEVEGERASVERLGGLPLVSLGASDPRGAQFKLKYAFERVIAACALLLAAPLLAAAASAVKLTMGGPVFFRQRRVGADGREFDMIKLRTMKGRPEEDAEADIDWALQELVTNGADPAALGDLPHAPPASRDRRTRLGRLLRRFSLDELPQLWNVLRGEMSLVGPRPERVRYVKRFERSIYRYAERHRVKSGITGWAQVNGLRGRTSLSDRVEWDNFYIENWSLWLDVKIVLMTAACVVRGQHEEHQWE